MLATSALPARLPAQTAPPALGIFGFGPGLTLDQVRAALTGNHGRGWSCRDAREDSTVTECRGTFQEPLHQIPVRLWLSAMGGRVGILTLQATLTPSDLGEWQAALSETYGPVGVEERGPLRMMQWVRRGRMLRLTWLPRPDRIDASISLVDGPILDRWGRPRSGG